MFYLHQILRAFNKLKIMPEDVLSLPNTESLQQVEDYCRRLFYLYQILRTFNKLKIMPEDVLSLPNNESLQQVEDYARGCSIFTKY
jgi:hypothetical protein